MAARDFTIDDAFQSDDEDPIRIYGSLNESSLLRSANKNTEEQKDCITPSAQNRDYDVNVSLHSDGSNEVRYE